MKNKITTILLLLLFPISSFAGAVITYHGRIIDDQGRPVESANVTFRIRILSPNPGKCLLYEESRTLNMVGSNGVFVIPIGDGVGDRNPVTDPGIPMEKIFSNDPSITFNTTNTPKLSCNSGVSYTPDVLHQRQLVMAFDDHSGVGEQVLPVADINFVPLAVNSYDSQKIGGTAASSVVRLSSGTATPLSAANFAELLNLVNGTTTQYEKSGKMNGLTLPTLTNGQVLGWSAGTWAAVTPMTSFTETDPLVKSFAKANLPNDCGTDKFLRPKSDGSGFDCVSTGVGGLATGQIWLGVANVATPVTPSKDVQVAADGKFTVTKIQGNAASSTTLTAPDANKFYKWDGSEFVASYIGLSDLRKTNGSQQIVACPAGQIATWESVTNDTFCVTISVGSGNFAAQNMNKVFAGPASGADAAPTFRTLASSDIPTLALTKISDAGTAAYKNVPAAGNAGVTEVVMGTDSRLTDARTPIDGSVTTAKIVDGNVTDAKINSLSASKLSGTVGTGNLPVAGSGASGIVNAIAQSFSGLKTFLNGLMVTGDATVSGSVTASSISLSGDAKDIKLATQTATCDASLEGAIKYDKSTKKIVFCDGSSWQQMSAGAIASLLIGAPNASLVKSGPVSFDITYGSGVDPGTITLAAGNISFSGTDTAGCAVSGITGSGNNRTVTINGCTGTGTVSISIAANTASSTTGDSAPAAGPSATYQVDNTGPSAPTGVTLGSVSSSVSTSPTITFTAGVDSGGSTVASNQVRIIKTSDSSVVRDWATHVSGAAITGLATTINTQYSVLVRSVDALGNLGTASAAVTWTSPNDLCQGSPNPGDSCLSGTVYLGSLSPGATSGSGTDKYMTTPGGCGEIPAGQLVGSGASGYPNADFTPTCSGTDALKKYWNNGTAAWYTIPGLVDQGGAEGTFGDAYTDPQYGSTNTTAIVAVTNPGQGGPHAAAAYCDKLVYGGYSDWYLPNRLELNLFYKNKASVPGLNVSGEYYWSSTEYPSTSNSWFERMDNGYQGYNGGKYLAYLVRCVRRF